MLTVSCAVNNNTLEITSSNFTDEIETEENLVFAFNHDLVTNDQTGKWDSVEYIKFSPPVKGLFKWNHARELVFSPASGFQPSTDYTAGFTDAILLRSAVQFNRLRILISSPLIALAMTGCGGGSDGTVVANETRTLAEGTYLTYALPAGKYEVQVASSKNGVVVEWIGSSNCSKSGEVKTYDYACTLTQIGQLKITNPTTFFLGGDEVVTVKVTQQ